MIGNWFEFLFILNDKFKNENDTISKIAPILTKKLFDIFRAKYRTLKFTLIY